MDKKRKKMLPSLLSRYSLQFCWVSLLLTLTLFLQGCQASDNESSTGGDTITLKYQASQPSTRSTSSTHSILFDNAHAESAGNADWVISGAQPDPLKENAHPVKETDWTGGLSAWGVALQKT